MIRRDDSDAVRLITQHDHALLSGKLAECLGNDRFAPLAGGPAAVLGIALHDCGWSLHDDQPTVNAGGQPLDVFEAPSEVALPVWSASAARAAEHDPYAGLLVSLHAMALSFIAAANHAKEGTVDKHKSFEMNKFQHREIERQEELRRQLGLSVERPLKHGLADEGIDPAEDALRYDFRLLQAMDRMSLAVCCTNPPLGDTIQVPQRPTAHSVSMRLNLRDARTLVVSPWPFNRGQIDVTVNCRRMDALRYESDQAMRAAYASAPIEPLEFSIRAG